MDRNGQNGEKAPTQDAAESPDLSSSNDGTSSFARLLDMSVPNNSKLRRRPSLFDNVGRPSRLMKADDEKSSFSLASLTQEPSTVVDTSQLDSRKSLESKNRRRSSVASSNGAYSSSLSASSQSTSRSLFTSLTVRDTQDVSLFNKADTNSNDNGNNSKTPKASGRGGAPSSARTSLFGSVMQQVGQFGGSNSNDNEETTISTPSKRKAANTEITSLACTPKTRRLSAFTPEKGVSMPFGSPSGFQLLDYVNTFASPFSKHNNNNNNNNSNHSNHSNLSTKSDADGNEWQNVSLQQGIVDWSLPENSLRLDCLPGNIINPFMHKQQLVNALGMAEFLQPRCCCSSSSVGREVANNSGNEGIAQWGSGLLYWQHPAVYPSPFITDKVKKRTKEHQQNETAQLLKDDLRIGHQSSKSKKTKQITSIDLAAARPLADAGNKLASSFDKQKRSSSLQQEKTNFLRQRRHEWKQAFASLYWKWISELQQCQNSANNNAKGDNIYFYAQGNDHVVLFRGEHKSGKFVPEIVMSASSTAFREKLRQSGVNKLQLLSSWNGHQRDALFKEDMIQQKKTQSKSTKKDASLTRTKTGPDEEENAHGGAIQNTNAAVSSPAATPAKKTGTASLLMSPKPDSNSPMLEAELAALRRAQVFGKTVGADVTVSVKPQKPATGPKLSLNSIPPLYVSGWDDCAAFFEVYLNLSSTCCIECSPSSGSKGVENGSEGNAMDKKQANKKANTHTQIMNWQSPDDVPLLICRRLGPFLHSSIKSLTVRGNPQYTSRDCEQTNSSPFSSHDYSSLEIQGGPILPCAMQDLLGGLVLAMIADQKRHPRKESIGEDDEAVVGSHNIILRAFPSSEEKFDEEQNPKHGIVGSGNAQWLNHSQDDKNNGADSHLTVEDRSPVYVKHGHTLDTAVWDILHPHAMAYKLEPIASSASAISMLQ